MRCVESHWSQMKVRCCGLLIRFNTVLFIQPPFTWESGEMVALARREELGLGLCLRDRVDPCFRWHTKLTE